MDFYLKHFAARNFAHIKNRKQREHTAEQRLVQLFFEGGEDGYFVEVGANDPKGFSQTWHLEQKGWQGILIEPIPQLCQKLREQRPNSVTIQAACGAPEQRGRVDFYISEDLMRSTLEKNDVSLNVNFKSTEIVDLKTLDDILEEIDPPNVSFVSIDVEGSQLNVIRGFSLGKYRPRLLLVEDHLCDLRTHRYLSKIGYRLVKRTCRNNWYIPREVSFGLSTPWERVLLWQKIWLHAPFRKLRTVRKRVISRRRQNAEVPEA